jgi:hypothetical protein
MLAEILYLLKSNNLIQDGNSNESNLAPIPSPDQANHPQVLIAGDPERGCWLWLTTKRVLTQRIATSLRVQYGENGKILVCKFEFVPRGGAGKED